MSYELLIDIVFKVVGGLGLFLLGMHNLSNGLQTVAGERLRWLIGKVTNNRIFAAIIGTFVTAIVQSSSITTVMVVGFVNASLMTLTQAIGVIMGANIGTTITGWILVVKIGKYGLPLLGISALFVLFSKKEKVKYIAMTLMGLGMIFFGLELMTNGFKPIRTIPEFTAWFQVFDASTYFGVIKCILTGAILTMIVQSSSATLGITMGLAATGVIGFETAAALVLGENIGTTITAFLASFGAKTNAKRAAYAHIIFNVLGVVWISLLFPYYLVLIRRIIGIDPNIMVLDNGAQTYPHITAAIASVHTGFNVVNVLIFLPFVKVLAKMLEKLVPDTVEKESEKLTNLDFRMLETPSLLVDQSKKEINKMSERAKEMFKSLKFSIEKDLANNDKVVLSIFAEEENLDIIQKDISTYLLEALGADISQELTEEVHKNLSFSDELESISDYITTISKLRIKFKNNEIILSDDKKADILGLHDSVYEYFNFVKEAIKTENQNIAVEVDRKSREITDYFKELRGRHLIRMSEQKTDALLSTGYVDILNSYRKIKDHIVNIAEDLMAK